MAFFSFSAKHLRLTDFQSCFRNALRLKCYNNCKQCICYRNIIKSSNPITIRSRNSGLLNPLDIFPDIHVRWIRCCKIGYSLDLSSKRKNKSPENVHPKFPTAKFREAKKKVQKKIVEIKENIITVPNGLCVLRIISSPFLAYLIISELYLASFGLFVFAGFTDLIDGYIARNFPNQQSMIGSFLDPAADKLLVATLFITLTINGLIPVPLTSMIILRDASLMGAGFYIRYVSLPPPKTFKRYFDMSFVTARLQPTVLSKANTLIQLSLAAASLAAPVFDFVDHFYLHILWYVTGTTTVLSAASYLYYKNATYKMFTGRNK